MEDPLKRADSLVSKLRNDLNLGRTQPVQNRVESQDFKSAYEWLSERRVFGKSIILDRPLNPEEKVEVKSSVNNSLWNAALESATIFARIQRGEENQWPLYIERSTKMLEYVRLVGFTAEEIPMLGILEDTLKEKSARAWETHSGESVFNAIK